MTDDHRIADSTTVTSTYLFFALTLVVSAGIVYLIGSVGENPDGTILAVLVPSGIAVALTVRSVGWRGVRSFLRLGGSAPASFRLWVLASLTIPLVAGVAVAIGSAVTGESFDLGLPDEGLVILLPLLIIAFGEEYGWRRYALRGLQSRYPAVVAALIIGLVHWVWHYPPSLIETGVPLDTPFWLFGIFVVSLSVLLVAAVNAGNDAVGLAILLHFSSNVAFVMTPLLPENRAGGLTTFSIFVFLMVMAAIVVVLKNRHIAKA